MGRNSIFNTEALRLFERMKFPNSALLRQGLRKNDRKMIAEGRKQVFDFADGGTVGPGPTDTIPVMLKKE